MKKVSPKRALIRLIYLEGVRVISMTLKEYYSQKSTPELQAILQADILLDEEDALGPDSLMAILEVMQERQENEPKTYPDVSEFMERFWENELSNIEERIKTAEAESSASVSVELQIEPTGKQNVAKRSRRNWVKSTLRVASIFLVALVLFGTVSVSAYAAGFNIWGAVAKWTDERFSFGDTNKVMAMPLSPDFEGDYYSLQDALDAYGITDTVAPTWIPNGYALSRLKVAEKQSYNEFLAACNGNYEGVLTISIVQHKRDDLDFAIQEKDSSEVLVHTMGGVDHYIMSNNGRIVALWISGGCECAIRGNITIDEMVRIIDSIYER